MGYDQRSEELTSVVNIIVALSHSPREISATVQLATNSSSAETSPENVRRDGSAIVALYLSTNRSGAAIGVCTLLGAMYSSKGGGGELAAVAARPR